MAFTPMLAAICGISSTKARNGALPDPIMTAAASVTRAKTMPIAKGGIVTALGITAANPDDSYMLVASFAAVSALFVLPTYPTLLGAVQMDDTGTTRIGKYVFNHAFFIPGVLAIAFSVLLGFLVVSMF